MSQLLVKKLKERLGGGKRGAKDIKCHIFFKDFAWEELLQRRMTSPLGPVERQHQCDPSSIRDISLLSTSVAGPTELHFEGFSCIVEGALSTSSGRDSSGQWQRTSASACCKEEEEEMREEGPTSPLSQPPSLAPSSTGRIPPAASPPPSQFPSPASSIQTAPSLLEPLALSCNLRTDSEKSMDCDGARAASLPDNFGHQQDAPSRLPSSFLRSQTALAFSKLGGGRPEKRGFHQLTRHPLTPGKGAEDGDPGQPECGNDVEEQEKWLFSAAPAGIKSGLHNRTIVPRVAWGKKSNC